MGGREKQTVERSDKGFFVFEMGGNKSCIWRNVPHCNGDEVHDLGNSSSQGAQCVILCMWQMIEVHERMRQR